MTSPRRLVASRFPVSLLGPALVTLLRQWHGASLATETIRLVGVVQRVQQGPLQRGVMLLDVDGHCWTVEIGPFWRSQRAGVPVDALACGRTVTAVGRRDASTPEGHLHADQLIVDGRSFDLVSPPH